MELHQTLGALGHLICHLILQSRLIISRFPLVIFSSEWNHGKANNCCVYLKEPVRRLHYLVCGTVNHALTFKIRTDYTSSIFMHVSISSIMLSPALPIASKQFMVSDCSDNAVVWRNQLPVLVMEAQTLGSIAVIRSLGQGGYPVHACAPRADALGLLSNYARFKVVCPAYSDEAFLPWLREYVRQHNIRTIIPSEGLLLALRSKFHQFAHLLPFSSDADTLYAGMSKVDLFDALTGKGAPADVAGHLPPTRLVSQGGCIPDIDQLERMGAPLYIKVDGSHSIYNEQGFVYKCSCAVESHQMLQKTMPRFRKALIQSHVPGQGVGVFLLFWNGEILAQFMHRRLHEVPHTGGISSFRESWWHPAIHEDAVAKVRYLGWQGVAMMEYRWDAASDKFYLMEMNGRFWGSLHLALYAGVNFPVLLVDAFNERRPHLRHGDFPRGLKCRLTFPKECEYVWSRLKDTRLPVASRLWSIGEFMQLSLDPRIYSDLLFPGDRKLFWESLKRFVRSAVRRQH
jgi:hypothetical protein